MKNLVDYYLSTDHKKKRFSKEILKEKENSCTTNFLNLNKHRLKAQSTRIIFIIAQPTAKALSHYGNEQTFELCIVCCQAEALKTQANSVYNCFRELLG